MSLKLRIYSLCIHTYHCLLIRVEIHHLQQMYIRYFLHALKQEYRATLGHKLDYVL